MLNRYEKTVTFALDKSIRVKSLHETSLYPTSETSLSLNGTRQSIIILQSLHKNFEAEIMKFPRDAERDSSFSERI